MINIDKNMLPKNVELRIYKIVEKNNPKKPINIHVKSSIYDFLKFRKVVFDYIRFQYDLTTQAIDFILFLYSEKVFDEFKLKNYSIQYKFGSSTIKLLINKKFISVVRPRDDKFCAVYTKTNLCDKVAESIYDMILGIKEIPQIKTKKGISQNNIPLTKVVKQNVLIQKVNKKININHEKLTQELMKKSIT